MRTRNALRILACFAFIMVLVFAFASCDKIKGFFDKHEHSYVPVMTQPTCTEKGYTTYTCECGESYVDHYVDTRHELLIHDAKDPTCTEIGWAEYLTCRKCSYSTYEEIPAIGHSFEEKITRFPTTIHKGILSTICTTCGESTDEEINAVSVTLPGVAEVIRTFVGMNKYTINAEDTEILLVQEIESQDGANKRFIAIDLACFELDGKTDDLAAYISFNLGVAEFNELAEGEKPEFTSYSLVNIVVYGDDVSVYVTENDQLSTDEFNLTEEFYGYIANNLGMTYDELKEACYLAEKLIEFLPILEGVVDWIGNIEINDSTIDYESIIKSFVDEIVYVDEEGYSHLDLNSLAELIESLGDKTVADMIDEYFGKGTMTSLEISLLALPTTKIRTLHKSVELIADTYDIPMDDAYALINYVIYAATGANFNLEYEIKTRYNKTVAQVIIELTTEDYENLTEADINMMALGMVESIKNVINSAKQYNLDQLYNLYYYDDASFNYSLTEEIAGTLRGIDASFDLSWHKSEAGTLDAFELTFTNVIRVKYDFAGDEAVLEGEIYLSDGTSYEIDAILSDSEAKLSIVSGENELASVVAQLQDGMILGATVKLNTLYVGNLEGYTEDTNLLNMFTFSYIEGEGDQFALEILVNTLVPSETEEGETAYKHTSLIDLKSEFNGVDTIVTKINDKILAVVSSETEEGVSIDVLVKEGENVLADFVFTTLTVFDNNGFVVETELSILGVVDGKEIEMDGSYVDGVLNAVCKLDGNEAVNMTVTTDDDGGITADVSLNGVNIDSEILVFLGQIIESIGISESVPVPNAPML